MINDFIGDMIIRIRNGYQARLSAVVLHSASPKYCIKILEILEAEGYISGFQYNKNNLNNKIIIKVFLKYNDFGKSTIQNIFKVSSSGRRIYVSIKQLWKIKGTLGVFLLSTPKGILTDKDARLLNVGGELLLGIY